MSFLCAAVLTGLYFIASVVLTLDCDFASLFVIGSILWGVMILKEIRNHLAEGE